MTFHQLVQGLSKVSVDPSGEAVQIVSALCGHTREWCLLNRHAELPERAAEILNLRLSSEPLQYILGEAWFYGYKFYVSHDCLIPQPDTEHCVLSAIKYLKSGGTLLDLCTGSGCIAISVLMERADIRAIGVDISVGALKIASTNAKLHGLEQRLDLYCIDVLNPLSIRDYISSADVIVSNPPYINSDVIDTLSSEVRCEPRLALDGGADGLDFYRRFILDYTPLMKRDAAMILEIGYDQSERIEQLCAKADVTCIFRKDFGGNIRVAEITRTK